MRTTNPKTLEKIAKEYVGDKLITISNLSIKYDTCPNAIAKYFKENSISIRRYRKYNLDESFFEKINTEEKAYFLGILYADGYNAVGKEVNIGLAEQDRELLEKLNSFIQPDRPLLFINKKNHNPNYQNMYRLIICSRKICDDLVKLGCGQKKSLILKFPTSDQVPEHLIRHFIRGYFDGDGGLCQRKTQAFKYTCSAYFTGTKHMLVAIQKILKQELDINASLSVAYSKTGKIFQLHIGGNYKLKSFMDWLYKDMTIYMKRKFDAYQKFKQDYNNKPSISRKRNKKGQFYGKAFEVIKGKEKQGDFRQTGQL